MNPFATHTWLMYDAQNTRISLKVDAYSGDKKLGINSADDLDAIDATNATNAIPSLAKNAMVSTTCSKPSAAAGGSNTGPWPRAALEPNLSVKPQCQSRPQP